MHADTCSHSSTQNYVSSNKYRWIPGLMAEVSMSEVEVRLPAALEVRLPVVLEVRLLAALEVRLPVALEVRMVGLVAGHGPFQIPKDQDMFGY